ncbi:MAG: heme ABC transporter permease [Pseudomonadota bacterium]
MLSALANPKRFMEFSGPALPWLWGACAGAFAIGIYLALFASPPDYQQGETVRIMYVHVPAAWMAMFVYTFMATASLAGMIWGHRVADFAAKAAAPVGAVFTALALITGMRWGKPMWGAWWQWDARLTSVLILFFLYLGYMALWAAIEDPFRAARAAAILCLLGFVNIPIIKFSVDWWSTLHQPASVFRADGPTIDGSMLAPLLVMATAYSLLFAAILFVRVRTEIIGQRIRALRQMALSEDASA